MVGNFKHALITYHRVFKCQQCLIHKEIIKESSPSPLKLRRTMTVCYLICLLQTSQYLPNSHNTSECARNGSTKETFLNECKLMVLKYLASFKD